MRFYIFSYFQVKPRIIHQNQDIRIPLNNIFLAQIHITKDCPQMKQHRDKSHVRHILIMLDQ